MRPRLWQTIVRSSLLRCPDCGQGKIAKSWRETHDECPQCGFDFRVEGGFYLGSIYLNYGLVAVIMLAVGMPLVWFGYTSPFVATSLGALLCILLAVWFWRYARSLWLGLGYTIDHNVRAGARTAEREPASHLHEFHLHVNEKGLACVCPYCHTRFRFAESKSGSWDECAFCHEKILLTPVRAWQFDNGKCVQPTQTHERFSK